MSDSPTKTCRRCQEVKPRVSFARHPATTDRLQSYCRGCFREYHAASKPESDQEPDSDPGDLYVMRIAFDDDNRFGVKVGRSRDPDARARQLARSLPFSLEVLATFPGQGGREAEVHCRLARFRNSVSREWFLLSPWIAVAEVSHALGNPLLGRPPWPRSDATPLNGGH